MTAPTRHRRRRTISNRPSPDPDRNAAAWRYPATREDSKEGPRHAVQAQPAPAGVDGFWVFEDGPWHPAFGDEEGTR